MTFTPTTHRRLRQSLGLGVGDRAALGASATVTPPTTPIAASATPPVRCTRSPMTRLATALLVFDRDRNGRLTSAGSIPTGGAGTGAGLGSQCSVAVSEGGHVVVAVDPGSDEVSLFHAVGDRLRLVDTESSGGDMPISATIDGRDV